MTTVILTSSSSQQTLSVFNDAYVLPGAVIYSTNDHAIKNAGSTDSNISLVVDGAVIGDNNGIRLVGTDLGVGNNELTIGSTGVVRNIDGDWAAIFLQGSNSWLNNLGEATGGWGTFFLNADDGNIFNAGILGAFSSIGAGAYVDNSDNFQLINTGLIYGLDGSIGIEILDSENVTLNNSGEIAGRIETFSSSIDFTNTGVVSGGVEMFGSTGSQITNSGLIDGEVVLASGDDMFNGFGGLALGPIFGGAGNDIIRSGYGDDSIEGGAGADLINGGLGDDWASYEGSTAGITLDFRTGVGYGVGGDASGDTVLNVENIIGSDLADAIKGDVNANTLRGLDGNDDLRGFGGADTLDGGDGADVLFGFADNDILDGGAGADVMVGGTGADVFRYDDGDTGRGQDSDRINDFGVDDILDLSGIDAVPGGADDAFILLSAGQQFTGQGQQARFVMNGDDVVLQFDIDGDQVPDGAIVFANGYMPTEDQIIL
ncbi:MAG: calcium-binding protein [Pseudomonadota bacterium]